MAKIAEIVAQNPWWKHGAEFARFDKNFREARLLVEQNARMALEYADRGYVFEIGKIAFQDEAKKTSLKMMRSESRFWERDSIVTKRKGKKTVAGGEISA